MKVGESRALHSQTVNIRRLGLAAEYTNIRIAHVVYDNKQDVRLLRRNCLDSGLLGLTTEQKQAKSL